MKEEEQKNQYVGVIKIFPLEGSNRKIAKSGIPAIFFVRVKKGSEPIYLRYPILKNKYPQILFAFFESKVILKDLAEVSDQQPLIKKKSDKVDPLPKQLLKEIPKQEEKELRDRMKDRTEKTNNSRQTKLSLSQNQSMNEKPRIEKNLLKMTKKQSLEYAIKHEQDSRLIFSHQEDNFKQNNVQIKEKPKKILDYDEMIEELGFVNLSSPAVIVNHRPKPQNPVFTYRVPDNQINIREIDRQPFSSEQFRQSEESQFLLDDRGKQKRRREKLQRQQQRQQYRNKGKKIKKKKKVN